MVSGIYIVEVKGLRGRLQTDTTPRKKSWVEKLQEKAGKGLYWALLLFVGIPVPGTGAWTGTLAASILDMDFKSSITACMCGVILAGIIMGLASMGLFSLIGLA